MLKFLKTTVAEDAITTVEVLVVVSAEDVQVVTEVQLQEEKEVLLQDAKVQVADLEATEVLLHVKVVLDQEANQEAHQLQELVVFLIELQEKAHQIEHQDAQKALVTHQDQEDQEENKFRSKVEK